MPTLWHHPRQQNLTLDQVIAKLRDYMTSSELHKKYKIVVGSDSQVDGASHFVTVIVVQRVGNGGTYFWTKVNHVKMGLRRKIFTETQYTLRVATELSHRLEELLDDFIEKDIDFDFEVHLDVGDNGDTRFLKKEVVGWVEASGFTVKTKPESFAASSVANKYTK